MNNGKQPAYPILDPNSTFYREGLTKREYFAAMAMQGKISGLIACGFSVDETEVAKEAVAQADALLKELEQ